MKLIIFRYTFLFFFAACSGQISQQKVKEEKSLDLVQIEKLAVISVDSTQNIYSWLSDEEYDISQAVRNQIQPPPGFERTVKKEGSFEDWLQYLPLESKDKPVLLFNGEKKYNQQAHFRIIKMDVGNKDLQQCADATMRLRAEYLYAAEKFDDIHFNFTNGDLADFQTWRSGKKITIANNKLKWISSSSSNSSYKSFRNYMTYVFMYAGTASLSKELEAKSMENLAAGDILIKGGFPGHAVMVIDVALNSSNGDKAFLLGQSYMPAQEMHILKNPANTNLNPWYSVKELSKSGIVHTPEWTFKTSDLKTWE